MSNQSSTIPLIKTKATAKKSVEVIPSIIPYLAKSGQLLLPKGLLPILAKTPAEIRIVKKALTRNRLMGIIQPLKETKTQKQLYQVGCVGRITSFSENEDGSLYIVLKGIKRFTALAAKSGFLQVDYTPYANDKLSFKEGTQNKRPHLMSMLKGYFDRINLDINWKDVTDADNESLTTSLAMMCPFDANEKQAILESESLEERLDMITAFIEMSEIQQSPHSWKAH